jgi:superoxide dismutase
MIFGAVLSTKHISSGALQPHHSTHHEQYSDEEYDYTTQALVMSGSNLRDQRAQQQPHEQAADVRRVIGPGDYGPKKEVVSHKHHYAS